MSAICTLPKMFQQQRPIHLYNLIIWSTHMTYNTLYRALFPQIFNWILLGGGARAIAIIHHIFLDRNLVPNGTCFILLVCTKLMLTVTCRPVVSTAVVVFLLMFQTPLLEHDSTQRASLHWWKPHTFLCVSIHGYILYHKHHIANISME